MDRALWLLLVLQWKGFARKAGRSLRSVKGIILTLLGLTIFAPSLMPMLVAPRPGPEHLEAVRRFMPVGLLFFCVLGLVFRSGGERAIAFSPAEINILFTGPFRQRQLLIYRIARILFSCAIVGLLMGVFLSVHAAHYLAAAFAMAMVFSFMNLFQMAVTLTGETIGAFAYNRRRKIVLFALAALIFAAVVPIGTEALTLQPLELVERIEDSLAMRIALVPFRPFVSAFTAERLWPDLAIWGGVSLAIDAALVAFLIALDAQYLELSANASAKIYAKLENARRRGGFALLRPGRKGGRGVPMPPRWGGVGPILWRQLTTARRDLFRLILGVMVLVPMLIPLVVAAQQGNTTPAAGIYAPALTMIGMISFILSSMLTFDFRADYDRMAELKALPIAGTRMAIGQILTPVLAITGAQWVFAGVIAAFMPGATLPSLALAAFVVPLNLMLIEVDNLLFLTFPLRVSNQNFSLQTTGQMMLTVLAKVLLCGVAGGLSAAVGAGAFFLAGRSWPAALSASWCVLVMATLPLLPLIAIAFDRLDVSRLDPE